MTAFIFIFIFIFSFSFSFSFSFKSLACFPQILFGDDLIIDVPVPEFEMGTVNEMDHGKTQGWGLLNTLRYISKLTIPVIHVEIGRKISFPKKPDEAGYSILHDSSSDPGVYIINLI